MSLAETSHLLPILKPALNMGLLNGHIAGSLEYGKPNLASLTGVIALLLLCWNTLRPFAMYCLDCKYNLQQLPAHTCPECGREFDPSDSLTFATSIKRRFFKLPPWEAIASVVCSVIYFVALFIDSQPSAVRHPTPWYYNNSKFIAFIILFGISIGLLLAVLRLKRWLAATLGSIAVLAMLWQLIKWVNRYY